MPKGVYTRPVVPIVFNDDGSASIPLYARDHSVREYALVDADDAAFVSQWRWHYGNGYARRNAPRVGGRQHLILMHRELLGLGRGTNPLVDHINRNTLDNRRCNIRIVTPQENCQNRPSYRNTSSAYRGVCWNATSQKWQAGVKVNGKSIHLGLFLTEIEAANAARHARIRLMSGAVD